MCATNVLARKRGTHHKLLHGEEEGHAFAAGQLHGHGGVVDAVLLHKLHVAAVVNLERAADLWSKEHGTPG